MKPFHVWFAQNRRWAMPSACVLFVIILICVPLLFLQVAYGNLKSSVVFDSALRCARTCPGLCERLGTPIESGFLVTGHIANGETWGDAALFIPVSGPKDSGMLRVLANKDSGEWCFTVFELTPHSSRQPIDLLAEISPLVDVSD